LAAQDDPAAITDIPGEKILFLRLADVPRLPINILHWSRHHRCCPRQGPFELVTLVGHVLEADYIGPLSLEVFNDAFRLTDPERTVTAGMRSLIALEAKLATVRAAGTGQPS